MKLSKVKTKFIITTGKKFYCGICNNSLNSKEGYLEITKKINGCMYSNHTKIFICWNCLKEILKEVYKIRRKREKIYEERIKKRILINLK